MRTLVNISWECSLDNCAYCWITGRDGVGKKLRGPELSKDQWIRALAKLPPGIVDFCGGEPTHVFGFADIVNSLDKNFHAFGMTTNLSHDSNVETLRGIEDFRRCAAVNCSFHHENNINSFIRRFYQVQEIYPPASITVVENPYVDYSDEIVEMKSLGLPVNVVPYQNPQDSNLPHPKGRIKFCSGGSTHVTVNPDGNVYRCLTSVRSNRMDEFFLGNLLTDEIVYEGYEGCDLNCDPEERKCWGINAWTEEGPL